MSRPESALDPGDPMGNGEPGAGRAAQDGSEDEQEESGGAPDPGTVDAPAREKIVGHTREKKAELHAQRLWQYSVGREDEKNASDGGREQQNGSADHEALMGFRPLAQKVGSDDQGNKSKQAKKLKSQESQRR